MAASAGQRTAPLLQKLDELVGGLGRAQEYSRGGRSTWCPPSRCVGRRALRARVRARHLPVGLDTERHPRPVACHRARTDRRRCRDRLAAIHTPADLVARERSTTTSTGEWSMLFSLEGIAPMRVHALRRGARRRAQCSCLRRSAAAIGLALVVFFVVRVAVEELGATALRDGERRELDHRGRTRSPPGMGVPRGERATALGRAAARSGGRPVMRHGGQELRYRLPFLARHRRLHARGLPPGEPVLALPGNRSRHLHRARTRAPGLLRLSASRRSRGGAGHNFFES